MNPIFDLFETLTLILWLLPLPFLGMALSHRGRTWWVGWIQVAALMLVCALEVAAQIGPDTGGFAWIAAREYVWNAAGGMVLMGALSEGGLSTLRPGLPQRFRRARRAAAGMLPLFVALAALGAGTNLELHSHLLWIAAYAAFEALAIYTTAALWVRALRALAATALCASILFPSS